ncbi:hypothetical protein CLV30_1388 [Haloactinopolyspora alba]|uniref:Uncharacterized protein n=1 Tax=Haloactinopolyspora alba TaxID=648780 RepID=A0A2P8D033_9ACTN|nr:hypothetical protein [Haloactinopolyspora alba]PSK90583.1 hypothetical protein CLV30_1388 [Haloactinopolyspora alba]
MSAIRCDRCNRRWRGQGDWNGTFERGRMVGALCPACQTPQENAEAVINEATLDYGVDERGRFRGRPKGGESR